MLFELLAAICWVIALIRQLTAIMRIQGFLLVDAPLSIQKLLNGVSQMYISANGAIDNLMNAAPFLTNIGTVMEYEQLLLQNQMPVVQAPPQAYN